jgi:hypothetical protein
MDPVGCAETSVDIWKSALTSQKGEYLINANLLENLA